MKKEKRGITLIALVITIIILLILATISIQALTQTGLFQNANRAKLETKRSQIKEWLSLNLMEVQTTNYDRTDSEILEIARGKAEKSEELKKLGKTVNVDGEISTEEDGQTVSPYFDVIVDNDMYKVSMDEQEFIGEVGKIVPSVDFSATTTSKSITLKITTKRSQGGTVECYIKGENDSNYGTAQKATDNQYTFDNLEQGKKYTVKVVVTSGNGQKAEKEKEYTTGDIKELTVADIEFEYNVDGTVIDKKTWTNKDVKVTAKPKVDIAGYTLVTKKNDGTWQETDNQTFSENGIMYVALTDGRNYGVTEATGNVTNIDKTVPTYSSVEVKNVNSKGYDVYVYGVKDTDSGVNRVQFPTWTEANGEDDLQKDWETNSEETGIMQADGTTWVYHVDVAKHNNESGIYITHIYICDNVGCTIEVEVEKVSVPKSIDYGTSIQNNYDILYTTDYPTGNISQTDMDKYNAGNYDKGCDLLLQTKSELISQNTSGKGYTLVNSGDNKYELTEAISNRWMGIHFYATEYTIGMYISNLRIYFDDNTSFTVREAVANGYIEPLVICESMHSYAQYTIWTDILNILDGNATSTKNYPHGLLIFKVKEKAKMTAISFYTNITWSTSYTDGLRIYKYYDGYEISTQPIQ